MAEQLWIAAYAPDGSEIQSLQFISGCAARFYARNLARGGTLLPGSRVEVQRREKGATTVLHVLSVRAGRKVLQG